MASAIFATVIIADFFLLKAHLGICGPVSTLIDPYYPEHAQLVLNVSASALGSDSAANHQVKNSAS